MSYTIVIPWDAKRLGDPLLLALVIWREASNQPREAKVAVAWTIRNRVEHPGWYGKDYHSVITKPCQFTSMVPPEKLKDPNLTRYPRPDDNSMAEAWEVAFDVLTSNAKDPTGGATYYYDKALDKNPPPWAAKFIHTVDIGDFHFYKPPQGVI